MEPIGGISTARFVAAGDQREVALPGLPEQAADSSSSGSTGIAGWPEIGLRAVPESVGWSLLIVHPELLPPSALTPLVRVNGKPGFVVADMSDVDEFTPDLR